MLTYEDGFKDAITTAIELVSNLPKDQAVAALREALEED